MAVDHVEHLSKAIPDRDGPLAELGHSPGRIRPAVERIPTEWGRHWDTPREARPKTSHVTSSATPKYCPGVRRELSTWTNNNVPGRRAPTASTRQGRVLRLGNGLIALGQLLARKTCAKSIP